MLIETQSRHTKSLISYLIFSLPLRLPSSLNSNKDYNQRHITQMRSRVSYDHNAKRARIINRSPWRAIAIRVVVSPKYHWCFRNNYITLHRLRWLCIIVTLLDGAVHKSRFQSAPLSALASFEKKRKKKKRKQSPPKKKRKKNHLQIWFMTLFSCIWNNSR
jgi:hypothetical protein